MGMRSRNTLFCFECGHSWKNGSDLITALVGCECPECGENLKLRNTNDGKLTACEYFGLFDVKDDYQVVRVVCLKKFMKKNEPADYYADEVMQHWINADGDVMTMEKQVRGFGYQVDLWLHNTALEFRSKTARAEYRHNINPWSFYPTKKALPVFRRNGFRGSLHGIRPVDFFKKLVSDPYFETLLKNRQYGLMRVWGSTPWKYWPAVKIAIRNNYIVKDAETWIDYLDLLLFFNKDLRNAKYVCPVNLKAEHDRYVAKKRAQDKKQAEAERRKRMEKDQREYEKAKAAFFGLCFRSGDLVVKVIETVQGFADEGDVHKHCVYTNEYYKKTESLVLSAQVNGTPVETVEVSLTEMKVKQAHGRSNQPTQYHADIVDLVTRNMKQIKKISKVA